MNLPKHFLSKFLQAILLTVFIFGFNQQTIAQTITTYQFRQVPQDKMEEFIKRETTYWSKVAEAAIEKGNLSFWGVFEKMGGFDIPNTPNVLFINSFNDIDAADMGEIWNASAIFPDVPIDQMETFSMSKVMHSIYLSRANTVFKEGAVPADDFKYVSFVFHNASAPGQLIALENEHWAPFIKETMNSGKTTQVGWGNAMILSPRAPNMHANTVSFDIYSSLKDALTGGFDDDVEFPQEGLAKINELETSPRINFIYRRIQVINPNFPE